MKEIGGYFSFDFVQQKASYPHSDGIHLNTGRNALEYILLSLNVRKLWIPYFTCDVVLEPIRRLNIEVLCYHINEYFEIADEICSDESSYILVNNYFGIKDAYIEFLIGKYGSHLIIDNSQAFYTFHHQGTNTFYSPRKFVGLPDGGIAYTANQGFYMSLSQDISYDRCSHLLKRIDVGAESAYEDFKINSRKLIGQDLKEMSKVTRLLLNSIDFENVKNIRLTNFCYLHQFLGETNLLTIPSLEAAACPMVYPYLTKNKLLKKKMIEKKVFTATYWPNVLATCEEQTLEYFFADNIVAIPIDQRYDECDMRYIVGLINEYNG